MFDSSFLKKEGCVLMLDVVFVVDVGNNCFILLNFSLLFKSISNIFMIKNIDKQ